VPRSASAPTDTLRLSRALRGRSQSRGIRKAVQVYTYIYICISISIHLHRQAQHGAARGCPGRKLRRWEQVGRNASSG